MKRLAQFLIALLLPAQLLAATGQTLIIIGGQASEPPSSNYATFDTRNSEAVWDFDTTTSECLVWKLVMPRNYAGGGVTVYVHAALSSATSGTLGWLVSFERVSDSQQDIDSDGFASAQTVTAATVPGTSGHVSILNVAVSNGANMDSVAVGEAFRLKLCRDVANDNAAGDAELYMVEIKEQ